MICRHKTAKFGKALREPKILIKSCIAGSHGDHLSTIKCNFGRKNQKVKNKNKHTCKKKNETTNGLGNNYPEGGEGGRGGWEMGEICPKTKSYLPLIKQKLISTPAPHIMIILRLTPPSPGPWKKVSSH